MHNVFQKLTVLKMNVPLTHLHGLPLQSLSQEMYFSHISCILSKKQKLKFMAYRDPLTMYIRHSVTRYFPFKNKINT